MATHPSVHALRIPRTEKPGGLQAIGLQRVGHDWSNSMHTSTISFTTTLTQNGPINSKIMLANLFLLPDMVISKMSSSLLTYLKIFFLVCALEKEMATHSSVLAWKIPGTGEPGGLPSMGSHRLRHDWSDLAVCTCSVASNSLWPYGQ